MGGMVAEGMEGQPSEGRDMSPKWLRSVVLLILPVVIWGAAGFPIPASGSGSGGEAEVVLLGKVVYQAHCAACHGMRGEGQPGWNGHRPDGTAPAPPHDSSGHTWHHPDPDLFRIVKEGSTSGPIDHKPTMPAFRATPFRRRDYRRARLHQDDVGAEGARGARERATYGRQVEASRSPAQSRGARFVWRLPVPRVSRTHHTRTCDSVLRLARPTMPTGNGSLPIRAART